jgi:hypothetical protein
MFSVTFFKGISKAIVSATIFLSSASGISSPAKSSSLDTQFPRLKDWANFVKIHY